LDLSVVMIRWQRMVEIPASGIRRVAIVGGGPAGATLATLLARRGLDVTVFARHKPPPLVIGESLVPAVVPFLRELGVEEEVASYSTWKPGATFVLDPTDHMSFTFAQVRKAVTNYSYNVPRDRFDESIRQAAIRAGAKLFDVTARLERVGDTERLRLTEGTLAATQGVLSEQPDLIVDASGRVRLVANALGLPTETGPRRDTALFAHLAGVPLICEGHVHTDRMDRGWCWRIPLPGRVSVGLVVPGEVLRSFGDTIEEQYDNYLRKDGTIGAWGSSVKRLTPVVKYTNYQLVTLRGTGPNWVLVGDAFGFIDPVFSSGLLVGFDAAERLARTIENPSERSFQLFERHVADHLRAWQRVVGYYYDGRLFTLLKLGNRVRQTLLGSVLNWHFETHLPRVFTGEATTHRYSRGLLHFMTQYGLARNDPSKLQVK
jgi:flavin-dependent dehydrogenase